jgi:O-succinylbenzoate synthase
MLESSLGAHQCLALATLPNFVYPNDLFPSEKFYRRDLCAPPMVLSAVSRMTAPESAGSGAEPNRELLLAQTLEHAALPGQI